jgi:RNA-directed DNA polymerase
VIFGEPAGQVVHQLLQHQHMRRQNKGRECLQCRTNGTPSTFSDQEQVKRRVAPKALSRFKDRVRELTQRMRGVSVDQLIGTLKRYLTGWRGYFGFCETPRVLQKLDEWIRRRIRCFFWKQWKRGRTRFQELTTRGVNRNLAAQTAGSPHSAWRLSCSPALSIALSNRYFRSLGLPSVSA